MLGLLSHFDLRLRQGSGFMVDEPEMTVDQTVRSGPHILKVDIVSRCALRRYRNISAWYLYSVTGHVRYGC